MVYHPIFAFLCPFHFHCCSESFFFHLIFRRHAETPNWTVVKTPALARMQGEYSILGAQGQILKRGRDLKQVLTIFETRKFQIVR